MNFNSCYQNMLFMFYENKSFKSEKKIIEQYFMFQKISDWLVYIYVHPECLKKPNSGVHIHPLSPDR